MAMPSYTELLKLIKNNENVKHDIDFDKPAFAREVKGNIRKYSTETLTQEQLYEVCDWFLEALDNNGDFGNISRVILKGGRGSCKTSLAGELVVLTTYITGESCICFMRHSNSLRKGIYRTIVAAISFLGLEDYFEMTVSPMQVKLKGSDACIDFVGCDNPQKLKGQKSPTGYYKVIFGDEVDSLDDNRHLSSVIQTLMRGNDIEHAYVEVDKDGNIINNKDSDRNTKSLFIGCYNPNMHYQHWTYDYLWESNLEHGVWVIHSNYQGVPEHWLGKGFLKEADLLRLTASKGNKNAWNQYLNQYMGIRVKSELELFPNVKIVDKFIRGVNFPNVGEDNILRGMDFGIKDKSAYVALNFDVEKRKIQIFYELYKSNADIVKDIALVAEQEENVCRGIVYSDNQLEYLRQLHTNGLNYITPAKKPPNSVEIGYNFLGLCEIEIQANCKDAIYEFTNAKRKVNKAGIPVLDTNGMIDHIIAAVRYALHKYILGYENIYDNSSNENNYNTSYGLGIAENVGGDIY